MTTAEPQVWPDLLLFLGDQVYADEASPRTREFIRARRDVSEPPGEEIADFEEYTHLYHESWSQPLVRWLLSTVPVAMIFDDHDIIDDWNISQRWLDDIRATNWWVKRIIGGLVAYWVYQHLGNLSPAGLAADELYGRVRDAGDAGEMLDAFARTADADPTTVRWSFDRCLGDAHLAVVDSRAARVLTEGSRDMLDDDEWRWLEERLTEPSRHVLIASSLPILMPRSIHDVEAWNQQVAAGAWGRRAARMAERMRREFDLEHWPAFPRGFDRMMRLVTSLSRRDGPPASVTLLSGDVHHAYVSRLAIDQGAAPVHQVVASPMRQTVTPSVMRIYGAGVSRTGRQIGRTMTRLAGLHAPPVAWDRLTEPLFANHVATIETSGDSVFLRIESAHQTQPAGPAELCAVIEMQLA
jgi:phosphodiesterase/alkaline phosphatase D-like protein